MAPAARSHGGGGGPPRPTEDDSAALGPGARLENYLIEGVLGRGAQGEVFLARDVLLQRPVAVKVLGDSSTEHSNAFHEARLIATLDHPNIVRVYHVAVSRRIWYMAMEYIDGGNIRTLVRRRGALDPIEALRFMLPVCDALAHAHEIGVIHRDIKPHNMLVSRTSVVKLADFGLARLGEDRGGSFIGTPEWVAPEIWRGGAATAKSDIYSLGASFYYMLTGEPPFAGASLEALQRAHLKQAVDIPAELPGTLRNVMHSCLAKNPADRPASARVLFEYLTAARDELTSGHKTQRRASPPPSQETPTLEITEQDRIAGDLNVMTLTQVASLRRELESALTGPRPLVVFHGHVFGLRARLVRALLDAQHESLHVAARAVLLDDSDSLLYVLAERLDVSAPSANALYQEIIAACVGDAATRSGVRSVIHLHAIRPLKSSEVGAFVELARRASQFNVTCLLVCDSGDVRAIASELEADGTVELLRQVCAPPPTLLDVGQYADAWTSVATGDALRWTDDAKRVAFHLTQGGPTLPFLTHNSCVVALAHRMGFVTSWCALGALAHGETHVTAEQAQQTREAKPKLWPDADALALLKHLREKHAPE